MEHINLFSTIISIMNIYIYLSQVDLKRMNLFLFITKQSGTINSKINDTPKGFYIAHFKATLDFSRSEFTCP